MSDHHAGQRLVSVRPVPGTGARAAGDRQRGYPDRQYAPGTAHRTHYGWTDMSRPGNRSSIRLIAAGWCSATTSVRVTAVTPYISAS
jgi:hypothetical protein